MKKMLPFILVGLSIFLFSHAAFAVDIPFQDMFHIPTTDQSYQLLQGIFGEVGGVLPGTPGILNTLFRIFNQAMLALATIIIMYTLFMSIVNTAQQGEFLGKKFESLWVPIRTVAGFSLIIPTPSGYSMIQIFMMWVVVQGIGAADTLWTATINYLQQNDKPVIAPVRAFKGPAAQYSARMLTNSICLHNAYNNYNKGASLDNDSLEPDFIVTSDQKMIGFHYHLEGTDCGMILWPTATSVDVTDKTERQRLIDKYDAYTTNFVDIMKVMNTIGKNHVFDNDPVFSATNNPVFVSAKSLDDALNAIARQYQQDPKPLQGMWKDAVDFGWIFAGNYYHAIAQLGNNVAGTVKLNEVQHYSDPTLGVEDQSFVNSLLNTALAPNLDSDTAHNLNLANANPMSGSGFNFGVILRVVNWPINNVISLFSAMITGESNPADIDGFYADPTIDPIIKIQSLGDRIMAAIETVFLIGLGILITATLTMAFCSALSPFAMLLDLMYRYIFTPIAWLMMIFFGAGLSMSVYVPLIPYLIFTFAAIGWMLAVIETMIAAPMVALGITHPEGGHELLGRAEPAFMLITNVFLRPTMLLFGLIAGMVLSYVAIDLFNRGYSMLLGNVAKGTIVGIGPAHMIMYIVIYISTIIAILNRSYQLIHLIPDNVLRWIGGAADQFGKYAGGEDEVERSFKGASGAVGQQASGVLSGMGKIEQTQVQGKIQESKDAAKDALKGGI